MDKIYTLIIFFSVFSFFGWAIESLYRTITEKRLVNSGFLYGPFVPIYGFGALLIYAFSLVLKRFNIFLEILIYTFLATFLEYISSYILEKIFSIKLWDYSDEKFNLNGRICLKFSIFWAILIGIHLIFLQDNVIKLIEKIPLFYRQIISIILLIYFVMDTLLSSKIYFVFSNAFNYIQDVIKKEFEPKDFLSKMKLPEEIKEFLLAMKKFPNLAKLWYEKMGKRTDYTDNSTLNWLNSFVKKETNFEIIDNKNDYLTNEEFMSIAKEIINNEEYAKLKNFYHHENSIYEHCIKVAWLSYKLGKIFNVNLKEMVRGALLHDFFLYNWRKEKPASGKLHAFEHPVEAYHNAIRTFGHLTKIEKDCILKHMWPLTIVPPKYIESFIVSISDKIVAAKEFSNEWFDKKNQNKDSKNI